MNYYVDILTYVSQNEKTKKKYNVKISTNIIKALTI